MIICCWNNFSAKSFVVAFDLCSPVNCRLLFFGAKSGRYNLLYELNELPLQSKYLGRYVILHIWRVGRVDLWLTDEQSMHHHCILHYYIPPKILIAVQRKISTRDVTSTRGFDGLQGPMQVI